ncbi:MAG: 1-acyl-sn-glycerol-3-phosphate acyltransferase, partial [Candidatus Ratteibacteria bacterium]|nr:1-acyl-sn-glycerol-3-phosphate acyltransferase [Candidatus Ratteibacteria bacterium]
NLIVSPLINHFLDIQAVGLENIPKESCIIVTHHCLYFDSSVLGVTIKRKIHGWIDEDAFSKPGLKQLCYMLEQIPVKTGGQSSREDYRKTKETSIMWLKNSLDLVAMTNDGASRYLLDEKGNILKLFSRINHSGAANLAMETNVPIIPTASWIPEKHQKELFISKGLDSIKYMERNKKIPYIFYFCKPLIPSEYANKQDLKENIRKKQIEAYEKISCGQIY